MTKKKSLDDQIDLFVNSIFPNITNQFSKKNQINYAGMVFDKEDIKSSIQSLISSFSENWFALGSNALLFQKRLGSFLNTEKTIFTNSGSSANLISVATLVAEKMVKKGDEVITVSTTFPTTINPLLLYGLKPVLVDTVLPSYTANLDQIEKAITNKTKLIMIPHINGSPNDMHRILEFAQKHDIRIIEDSCDSFGSKFDGKLVGTFGDLGTFSFYAAHHMSTGEGGAVSGSSELISTAESIRDWGRVNLKSNSLGHRKFSSQKVSNDLPDDYEKRYTYANIGYNLKPLDMQAALGLSQLKKISSFTKKRKNNYKFLYKNLEKFSDKIILPEGLPKADPSWFVFPITLTKNSSFHRSKIIRYLEKNGIETRPILAGEITSHPAYKDIQFRKIGKLESSRNILENSFFIGVYPGLDSSSLDYVVDCFTKFFKTH